MSEFNWTAPQLRQLANEDPYWSPWNSVLAEILEAVDATFAQGADGIGIPELAEDLIRTLTVLITKVQNVRARYLDDHCHFCGQVVEDPEDVLIERIIGSFFTNEQNAKLGADHIVSYGGEICIKCLLRKMGEAS